MEAEERPAKLRKTTHNDREMDAALLFSPEPGLPEAGESREHIPRGETTKYEPTAMTAVKDKNSDSIPKDNGTDKVPPTSSGETADNPPLSKNQRKKLLKQQQREATKEEFKANKREKRKEAKVRKREAREAALQKGEELPPSDTRKRVLRPVQVPVTILFDCDFDEYMTDKEMVSLTAQITRSYSDNVKYSKYRAHLAVSSYGGRMKDRLENLMQGHHTNWKGIQFFEEDFVKVTSKAKIWMKGQHGGKIAGALATHVQNAQKVEKGNVEVPSTGKTTDDKSSADETQSGADTKGEIIYLSSDSDNTLTYLSPYSTYIIGGIVDKNRHKGLCYKRALDHNIKTARLPIGQYLKMNSRQVLTTNHVNEIMLKWFETGDWGEAFMQVIPKRKGGELIESTNDGGDIVDDNDVDDDEMPAPGEDDARVEADAIPAKALDRSVEASNQVGEK